MKCLLVLVSALVVYHVEPTKAQYQDEQPLYDTRYDYLDVDAILGSKRLVRNYVDCLLNKKPCTPEGKALKRILPEGLRTKCARCTERQKRIALIVLRRLRDDYPQEWSSLSSKWDPTGDFTRHFEEFLAREKFNSIGGEEAPAFIPPVQEITTQPARPLLLNRFGDSEETPRPVLPVRSVPPTLPAPAPTILLDQTTKLVDSTPQQATTQWDAQPAADAQDTSGTRVTFRPFRPTVLRPTTVLIGLPTRMPDFVASSSNVDYNAPGPGPGLGAAPSFYAGTMGLIDHFGNKIIRTTELVTDLLRNTVRAVVGG